jgi:hypothetical protein
LRHILVIVFLPFRATGAKLRINSHFCAHKTLFFNWFIAFDAVSAYDRYLGPMWV